MYKRSFILFNRIGQGMQRRRSAAGRILCTLCTREKRILWYYYT